MILWEKSSLDDREAIFEFLYEFNPLAAEKTDAIIEKKVENLNQQPLMRVERGHTGKIVNNSRGFNDCFIFHKRRHYSHSSSFTPKAKISCRQLTLC